MRYVDTSVLVALHVPEPHSVAALRWLNTSQGGVLACSDWGQVEFASALSRKIRARHVPDLEREFIEHAFAVTLQQNFVVLPTQTADYRSACQLLRHHATGLRAGDALHLAITQRVEATLVTLDDTMARAARHFGIAVAHIA